MISNDTPDQETKDSASRESTKRPDNEGSPTKVDVSRLATPSPPPPPQTNETRRKSLFDWSTVDNLSEVQPNSNNIKRKSIVDTLSVDPGEMTEDLGFQWTPSIRLRASKRASVYTHPGETLSANPLHATLPDHGDDSRPPTRLINDDELTHEHLKEFTNLIYFNDGRRRIDYVLVYDQGLKCLKKKPNDESTVRRRRRNDVEKVQMRQFFQDNLLRDGLQLEEDVITHSATDNREVTIFVKVHGTWAALCRQAELLKMKMPLRLRDTFTDQQPTIGGLLGSRQSILRRFFRLTEKYLKKILRRSGGVPSVEEEIKMNNFDEDTNGYSFVTWPFQTNKIDKYAIVDQDSFFTPTQRMEMVWEILQNARNDPSDEKKRGIEQLLDLNIYDSAYPLHDGPANVKKSKPPSKWCERQRLRQIWANWKCVFNTQPLELIRRYYGEKVGFYFAFLGFYTKMLTVPAFVGLCTFFYGIVYSGDDVLVRDVCESDRDPGNRTMCPICRPPNCESTLLSDSCMNTQWDYRMDNEATLFMGFVTVVWATIFMKAWKRREAALAYEWDTYEVEQMDGVVRPEYEERAPSTRRNPVTRESEPYVPWSTRSWWLLWSMCITLFMLFAVGAALGGLVLARVALYGLFNKWGIHHSVELARWFVHGLIFIVVLLFDTVYSSLGKKATSLECPRTQSQWLSSFLWKLFIFELLNDFIPIGYAAFFKGMSIRTPLDFTWKSEICDSGGCMGEVTELVCILLLARLVVGNGIEIGVPFLKTLFAKFATRDMTTTVDTPSNTTSNRNGRHIQLKCQWLSDHVLNVLELDGVADEYMEMIVQFAFVTLFVPAFPVAPLVCLLNNILEIRVDAIKFIVSHRRPLPIRVPGIQIWNQFLNIVAKLAVLCNGALMSFTSMMIPRLYYKYVENNGTDYDGFIEFSLSKIPTIAWYHNNVTEAYQELRHKNITECYYQHQRSPYEENNFDLTTRWWKITCVRLAAFCLFIALAYSFQWLYDFLVPDVPTDIRLKMQRRRYVVSKAMEAEMISDKFFKHHPSMAGGGGGTDQRSLIKESIHQNGSNNLSKSKISNGGDVHVSKAGVKTEEICEVEPVKSIPVPVQNGNRLEKATTIPTVEILEPSGPQRGGSMKASRSNLS